MVIIRDGLYQVTFQVVSSLTNLLLLMNTPSIMLHYLICFINKNFILLSLLYNRLGVGERRRSGMPRCVLWPCGSGGSVVSLSSAAHKGCGKGWGTTRSWHYLQDTIHCAVAGWSMFCPLLVINCEV